LFLIFNPGSLWNTVAWIVATYGNANLILLSLISVLCASQIWCTLFWHLWEVDGTVLSHEQRSLFFSLKYCGFQTTWRKTNKFCLLRHRTRQHQQQVEVRIYERETLVLIVTVPERWRLSDDLMCKALLFLHSGTMKPGIECWRTGLNA